MSEGAVHTTAPSETPELRTELLDGLRKRSLLIGFGGLIAFAVLFALFYAIGEVELKQVFLSYQTGFIFWIGIGIGSLFFLVIQYITGGRWGILLRRPLEANAKTFLPIGLALFIPVAVGMMMGDNSPYWWAGVTQETIEHSAHAPTSEVGGVAEPDLHRDAAKKVKELLSPAFTIGRGVLYFLIFGAIIFSLTSNAFKAENDPNLDSARQYRRKVKRLAIIGLYIFPVVLTFIVTDWIMSLDETFASSMFPVIAFDDFAVTAYAIGLLTLLYLKDKNHPKFQAMFPQSEQIHLGSLLLAFTLGWTYFNFSQYMLIWIGNLPEEIPYYLRRTRGGWGWYAVLMVVFHFPIPFLLLLFRRVKSNEKVLKTICIGLILVCFGDMLWWHQPAISHEHSVGFYWILDILAWIGIGGVWLSFYFRELLKQPLLPTRETYLLEEYHHGH
jgi:hypothetical protein